MVYSERCIARYKTDRPAARADNIVIATKFLPLPYKLCYPSSLINALRGSLDRLKVGNAFRASMLLFYF